MPNQQIFPQSTYPLTGDIQSTAGDPTVVVQGFQRTPVSSTPPQDGQVYVYVAELNRWVAADPIVSGPNAVGTSPTANPVQVGGTDDGNLVRELRTDGYGAVQLSMFDRQLLTDILNQLKALTRAVVNLDNTNQDPDYVASSFDGVDPML